MRRWSNVPYNPSAVPPPGTKPPPPQRVPQAFIEAMKRLTSEKSATQQAKQTEARSSGMKWKSSFKPVGDEEENSEDKGTSGSERLYDPYSPLSSDTEADPSKTADPDRSPLGRGTSLERQRLSPGRGSRWDIPYPEPESRALDTRELSEGRGPGPGDEDRPGYGSMSRALDHRGCSPDGTSRSSSTHRISPYSQRVTEEERTALPEYRREISTTVRLSPPRLNWSYERQPFPHTGLNRDPVSPRVRKSWSKNVVMNKDFISCDLCDVVVANGQELDEHFDSRSHWDTLEHIQQNNSYDDVAIAFLQDVMLYKSRQCSRAMEDAALPALQENEYMTKVEMFHCAACKVFVYSSAAEVKSHISSHEHLSNTKEFEAQQRRACLSKAETMMQDLQPQLELFLKGGSPFK